MPHAFLNAHNRPGLDGIAKHAGQVFEFIEPIGLGFASWLWQPLGFELGHDALVSGERLAPFPIGKGLFKWETWAHPTSIRVFSRVAYEQLPDRYEAFRHAEQFLDLFLFARGGNHVQGCSESLINSS